jgi:hypothetical protein
MSRRHFSQKDKSLKAKFSPIIDPKNYILVEEVGYQRYPQTLFLGFPKPWFWEWDRKIKKPAFSIFLQIIVLEQFYFL